MSTYACWRLWVGIKRAYLHVDMLPERTWEILDQLYDEPYKVGGLQIENITLIGQYDGVGVIVAELHWGDENDVFDVKMIAKAKKIVPQLQKIFDKLGIKTKVAIMHNIDLGG